MFLKNLIGRRNLHTENQWGNKYFLKEKISKVHETLGVLSPMKEDPGGMGTIRLAGGTIRLALTDAKK